jgi:hypothetical protein
MMDGLCPGCDGTIEAWMSKAKLLPGLEEGECTIGKRCDRRWMVVDVRKEKRNRTSGRFKVYGVSSARSRATLGSS